jgi:AcrR family transcriptional regulator
MASDDRLSLLLDRLADYVLAHGLTASSLRPLARAAGTSDRMLLYYFADKDAVMAPP